MKKESRTTTLLPGATEAMTPGSASQLNSSIPVPPTGALGPTARNCLITGGLTTSTTTVSLLLGLALVPTTR